MGNDVAVNVRKVRERISEALHRAGRDLGGVELIAVSKGIAADRIREAIAAGVDALGENRVQEAEEKISIIGRPRPWHMVGRLQTNKARDALNIFAIIQSLDRVELAHALDRRARSLGMVVDVLVQVNIAGEPTKAGFSPDSLRGALEAIRPLGGIRVRGLMAMPPETRHPGASRPWFRKLGQLRREVETWGIPRIEMEHLSMGTSQDFEIAVEEGATMVRVGQAIFGPRDE